MVNVHYRWIPCFFDETTHELMGRNWYYDILVSVSVWVDSELLGLDELPIWVDVD